MGNRAVLSLGKYKPETPAIYLHWNGGRDSIEGFLKATKKVMETRGEDAIYASARLVQVIGNFFEGNLCIGLGSCKELDCDNYDNGVYELDMAKLEIVGRHHHERNGEQKGHELDGMVKSILDKMPENYNYS